MTFKQNLRKQKKMLYALTNINAAKLPFTLIDTSVQNLTNDIQEALKIATDPVPYHILKLIKFKRKIRRLVQKHNNPAHKTLFNYLERNLKLELSRHKNHVLEDKLTYLKEFNQSESKHWQALLSINKENNKMITVLPAIQPKLQNYLHSNIRETMLVYLSNRKLYAYN
ncbi:hypothetical protein BpHYR1_047262 [Brachionus plicatilis]|uniref:RNA-directed DNA polymerase from mobile element jockey-like n=1 Tax=Brachionus plicatilis TaxID=10195 RepID=A0A3M7SNE1_BRAPC|nr:hypothetical protein BpHYR1_047262 [Brachionus plicatilis]